MLRLVLLVFGMSNQITMFSTKLFHRPIFPCRYRDRILLRLHFLILNFPNHHFALQMMKIKSKHKHSTQCKQPVAPEFSSSPVEVSSVSDSSPDSPDNPGSIFLNAANFSAICLDLYRVLCDIFNENFYCYQTGR